MRLVRALLLILLIGIPMGAYMPRRILTPSGLALEKWADSAFPIVWQLNTAKGSNVSGSRDVADVVRQAFQVWSGINTARISFQEGPSSTLTNAALDRVNLVSFIPVNYTSGVAAMTIVYSSAQTGFDAFGRRIEFPGQIMEADIVLNPNVLFTTNLNPEPDRHDLQGTLTHEIGHFLGLDHSGLVSAAMFPAASAGNSKQRVLSTDDIIGLSSIYPQSTFMTAQGGMRGVVRAPSGAPVFGAHVVITDTAGRPVLSALTDPNGVYHVQGLDPGNYAAHAEPLDAPFTAADLTSLSTNFPGKTVSENFTTRFATAASVTDALTLTKTAGDGQTGNIGEALTTPLDVEVRDSSTNAPVAGATVVFFASSGGGAVVPATAVTDAQGKARSTAYMGAGRTQNFIASVSSRTATFVATLRPPALTSITPSSGAPGSTVNVTLSGTNFIRGATALSVSGADILLSATSVTSPTTITAALTIDTTAASGPRSVTVATPDGTTAALNFTVAPAAITTLSFLDPVSNQPTKELTVNEGNILQPRVRAIDSNGGVRTGVAISFISSNPEVASVESSLNIRANKAGFSTLTASGAGLVATATVAVVQVSSGSAAGTTGIAQDPSNRIYLVASQDHTVRTAAGITQALETYAGISGSPGFKNDLRLQSQFRNPSFVAVDPKTGILYVTDSANHVIRRVHPGPAGRVEPLAGTGAAGSADGTLATASFNNPQGIVLDDAGKLWIADSGNHTIRKIDLEAGTVSTLAGLAGSSGSIDATGTQARFNVPFGLAIETQAAAKEIDFYQAGSKPAANLIVADLGNGLIRRVRMTGEVQTILAPASSSGVSESEALLETSAKSSPMTALANSPLRFDSPAGVALDQAGNIYVSEAGTGSLKIILRTGTVVAASQPNTLRNPRGVAVAGSGRVLVTDNNSAQQIDYGKPKIDSISGEPVSGAQVTIKGRNFSQETIVIASGVAVTNVTVQDTETIVLTVPTLPAGAGASFKVLNRGGIVVQQFGTAQQDRGNAVGLGAGRLAIAGATAGSLAGQQHSGGYFDAFVRVYDVQGAELWTRLFGTSGSDSATAVAIDNNRNVYVGGATWGTIGQAFFGQTDGFIRKYSPTGDAIWTIQFGTSGHEHVGGLAADASGNIYVVGQENGEAYDAYARKYDPNGNLIWHRVFGTPTVDAEARLTVDASGNLIIGGRTEGAMPGQTHAGGRDVWLRKYSPGGDVLWARQFGTAADDGVGGLAAGPDGSVIIAGDTFGNLVTSSAGDADAIVRKYDSDGNILWTRQFGSSSYDAGTVVTDGYGNIFVVGHTAGFIGPTPAGLFDIFVRKYDPAGTELWTYQFGTAASEVYVGAAADSAGYVYITGTTYGGAFPGQNLAGGEDVFVARVDGRTGGAGATSTTATQLVMISGSGQSAEAGVNLGNPLVVEARDQAGNPVAGVAITFSATSGGGRVSAAAAQITGADGRAHVTATLGASPGTQAFRASATALPAITFTATALLTPSRTELVSGNNQLAAVNTALNAPLRMRVTNVAGVAVPGVAVAFAVVSGGGSVSPASIATNSNGEALTNVTLGAQAGTHLFRASAAALPPVDFTATAVTVVQSQTWIRQFGSTLDDRGNGVALRADRVAIAGHADGAFGGQTYNGGPHDAFVRVYDVNGNELWSRLAGTNADDTGLAVAFDNAGNVYLGGQTWSVIGQSGFGLTDGFLRKYSPNGDVLWTRQFGTSGHEHVTGIAADPSGNIYVVGMQGGEAYDAYARKYDGNGNLLWERVFGTSTVDTVSRPAVDGAGNLIIGGSTRAALPGQAYAGGSDSYLRKYSPEGVLLWTSQFGTSADEGVEGAATAPDGSIFVAGSTNGNLAAPPAGDVDIFVRKYDSNGNAVWTKQLGTATHDNATVAIDSNGNYLVIGHTAGNLGPTPAGMHDIFIRKYDAAGTELWAYQFGTAVGENFGGAVGDAFGNVYITGTIYGGAFAGQSLAGGNDAFVAKVNTNAN